MFSLLKDLFLSFITEDIGSEQGIMENISNLTYVRVLTFAQFCDTMILETNSS